MTLAPAESDTLFRQSVAVAIEDAAFTVLYKDASPNASHRTGPVMHAHVVVEIHLILSGIGELRTEDGALHLQAGDCVMIGKNIRHLLTSDEKFPLERFELQIVYEGRRKNGGLLRFLGEMRVGCWHGCDSLRALAADVAGEIAHKGFAYRERLRAHFTLFLTELIRLAWAGTSRKQPFTPADDTAVISAADLMAVDNILTVDHRISAGELADKLSISKRQLFRTMSKYHNGTFKQKLIAFRIEKAMHLLKSSSMPLSEIAQQVGYDTVSSFCKAYKKKTGMSPGQYRKSAQ